MRSVHSLFYSFALLLLASTAYAQALVSPQQTPPIRMQPLQTPPKSITHNGVTVYQQGQSQPIRVADRTMPAGYGAPYPTGTQPQHVNPNASFYNQPLNQPPYNPPQPQYAAPSPQTAGLATNAAAQPLQYRGGSASPLLNTPYGLSTLPPFVLQSQEQQELDQFLARWEKISESIKQYQADFNLWKYDQTIPGVAAGQPYKQPFGSFRFIAPDRFVYHIEGEWLRGEKVERDEKNNPNVLEEKIIIDNEAIYLFDYSAKKVRRVNIPPERAKQGIADSPLPLVFGAKAADLKKRFSMKIVTRPDLVGSEIWLQARPLTPEDQQEFQQIEIRLDANTLRAKALKKDDINGKAYDAYVLENVKINDLFSGQLPQALAHLFKPDVPRGWQLEVTEMNAAPTAPPQGTVLTNQPIHQQMQQTAPRQEIPLYTP